MALSRVVSKIFEKYRELKIPVNGSFKVNESDDTPFDGLAVYGFLLAFYSNYSVPKTHRFLSYSTCNYTVTLKSWSGSFKVIITDTDRSVAYNCLYIRLNVPSMGPSRTVSEINGDFSRKSQNFHTPIYFAPQQKGIDALGIKNVE